MSLPAFRKECHSNLRIKEMIIIRALKGALRTVSLQITFSLGKTCTAYHFAPVLESGLS